MPVARAQARINVPIEIAWSLLTDFASYGDWNPFITRVEGPSVSMGSEFRLHVRWPNGSGGASSLERTTVLEPPHQVEGGAKRAVLAYQYIDTLAKLGLVRATRTHTFIQKPGGPTEYETEEVFRGLLSAFIPLRKVQAGFDAQTKAMQTTLESRIK